MNAQLKPCPFCGETVQLNVNMSNPANPYRFISCHKCNANITFNWRHKSDEQVREAWNRRAERLPDESDEKS
jgi:Lar family restriction alleviation protein